jgi:hypothetical protein
MSSAADQVAGFTDWFDYTQHIIVECLVNNELEKVQKEVAKA